MAHIRAAAVAAGLWLALAPLPAGAQLPAASARVKLGTVDVRDLAFNTPAAGRWSIGRIGFTGYVQDGGRVRAERIDIERVAVTTGTQTTEIPSIVMSGA